ncbi:MAG: putative baseplate assembly protein [Cyanobacteria bacterium P01_F01_bin.13]
MITGLTCNDEQRRHVVRQRQRNGLDYLEVSDDQRSLCVHFIGPVPTDLRSQHLIIKGGRRIRDIQVTAIDIEKQIDPTLDGCLKVYVDQVGDFSTYTLCLVDLDNQGRSTERPHPDFDPRYAQLQFSFKAGCPSDLDCLPVPCATDSQDEAAPEISYLAKDYGSFRQLILDRLSLLIPDWQERHVPDLGITLVELLAYVGDHLSYYQDAVATEAYLNTARQRISVRRHTRLIDYPMHEGCNARTWVHIALRGTAQYTLQVDDTYFITRYPTAPARGSALPSELLQSVATDAYEVFEPVPAQDITLYEAHNEIHIYTWGDRQCCLSKGTTTATLLDSWVEAPADSDSSKNIKEQKEHCDDAPGPAEPPPRLLQLKPGDILFFEEVFGPTTGNPADADPSHRHGVKLTKVNPVVDPLYTDAEDRPLPLLEIEWAMADALPFTLCISAIGPAPNCHLLTNISVVRGNVILADHGRTIFDESLGIVPEQAIRAECTTENRAAPVDVVPGRFTPRLDRQPLTFCQPLLPVPASQLLQQNPQQALPHLQVQNSQGMWIPQRDLLASRPLDKHVVAEMDDGGHAHLRFGDGESGLRPAAGTEFRATYRIGNGVAGNIGAETLAFVVLRNTRLSGIQLEPRNLVPAVGGIDPEPIDEVKLFAPGNFRQELQRAITAEDYAELVMRDFADQVQRAAATLRWTGSWTEVLVAVDPLGSTELSGDLRSQITQRLYRYRRMGHDVVVQAATLVPLHIEMLICVHPDYIRGHVKAALLTALGNSVSAQGPGKVLKGFFHPDRLSFGEGITLSRLVATAQAIPGVDNIVVTTLERLHAGPNGELEQGLLPLGPLEVAQLDNDPNFPENGQLILHMRGGR